MSNNRNAVIIGGTSGLGLGTAEFLSEKGYNVVVGGRSEVKIKGVDFLYIDVASENSVKNFFNSLSLDKIDALVYSAGTTTAKKDITEFSTEEYFRVHDVNLLGAILVLKYAYKSISKAKGRIVIVSSLAARMFSQFSGFEYTITKTGLSGLVKQLAIDFAKDKVRINTIYPGMIETPLLSENVEQSELDEIVASIPMRRIARTEDIIPMIALLISEQNNYITGAGIDINGGQYLTA